MVEIKEQETNQRVRASGSARGEDKRQEELWAASPGEKSPAERRNGRLATLRSKATCTGRMVVVQADSRDQQEDVSETQDAVFGLH